MKLTEIEMTDATDPRAQLTDELAEMLGPLLKGWAARQVQTAHAVDALLAITGAVAELLPPAETAKLFRKHLRTFEATPPPRPPLKVVQ